MHLELYDLYLRSYFFARIEHHEDWPVPPSDIRALVAACLGINDGKGCVIPRSFKEVMREIRSLLDSVPGIEL